MEMQAKATKQEKEQKRLHTKLTMKKPVPILEINCGSNCRSNALCLAPGRSLKNSVVHFFSQGPMPILAPESLAQHGWQLYHPVNVQI